jgi:uncharacterized protein with NRDE domain
MCTVSFIPINGDYYITSNRDEKLSRAKAIPPTVYGNLIFPKDSDGGGTWIAIHENGNAAVLLNGAFEKHRPSPPYHRSRGAILLDIMRADWPVDKFIGMQLDNIEPFTLVMMEERNLYKCHWDGKMKYCMELKKDQAYIWSSVTLYDPETAAQRKKWLNDFLTENSQPTQEQILGFHQFGGIGDPNNDLQIARDGLYSTVSVTGISLTSRYSNMKYIDLQNGERHEHGFKLQNTIKAR